MRVGRGEGERGYLSEGKETVRWITVMEGDWERDRHGGRKGRKRKEVLKERRCRKEGRKRIYKSRGRSMEWRMEKKMGQGRKMKRKRKSN